MNTLTVTAVRHKDIRDKEQLYVIMTNENGDKAIINVGQKTFDSVNELTGVTPKANETTKLFIEEGVKPQTEEIPPKQTREEVQKNINKLRGRR